MLYSINCGFVHMCLCVNTHLSDLIERIVEKEKVKGN